MNQTPGKVAALWPYFGGGGVFVFAFVFPQLSGTCVMPDLADDAESCRGPGFCQASGTKVMPDFAAADAALPPIEGTSVGLLHCGQIIWWPAYRSSNSRRCLQFEHSNFIAPIPIISFVHHGQEPGRCPAFSPAGFHLRSAIS